VSDRLDDVVVYATHKTSVCFGVRHVQIRAWRNVHPMSRSSKGKIGGPMGGDPAMGVLERWNDEVRKPGSEVKTLRPILWHAGTPFRKT
jgi:hypothetical protein